MKTDPASRGFKLGLVAVVAGIALNVVFVVVSGTTYTAAYFAGYTVGLFGAALHFLQANIVANLGNDRFFSTYGRLTLARFVLILALFVALIMSEKIDQFSFTVSFLISYIYNSVIDIYLIKDD
jgi:hypothetical protein